MCLKERESKSKHTVFMWSKRVKQCVNGIRGTSWLLRDKEMKASEGGYRETESGLDASFMWSHDKSGKDKGRGGG